MISFMTNCDLFDADRRNVGNTISIIFITNCRENFRFGSCWLFVCQIESDITIWPQHIRPKWSMLKLEHVVASQPHTVIKENGHLTYRKFRISDNGCQC